MRQQIKSETLFRQLQQVYDLRVDPFSSGLPFFYRGAEREEAVDKLVHALRFGDLIPLLTGERGVGKTSLLAEVIKSVKDEFKVVILKSSMLMDGARFLEQLFNKDNYVCPFPFNQSEPETLVQAFRVYLTHKHKQTKPRINTLVVVDDVDDLAEETVRLMLQGVDEISAGESGVHFILAAQSGWTSGFVSNDVTNMLSGMLYQVHVQPLSQEDTENYVRQRLYKAGAKPEILFSNVQLSALCGLGKGNPGRINRVAPGVLLGTPGDESVQASDKAKLRFTFPPLKQAAWALLAVSVICVSCLLYLYGGDDSENSRPESDASTRRIISSAPGSPDQGKQESTLDKLARLSLNESGQGNDTSETNDAGETGNADLPASAAGPDPYIEAQAAQLAESSVPATVKPLNNTQPTNIPSANVPPANVPAVPEKKPLPELDNSPIDQPAERVGKSADTRVNSHANNVENSGANSRENNSGGNNSGGNNSGGNSVANQTVPPDNSTRPGFRSAGWVKSQNPSHYLVQLLGSYNETTARRFLKQYSDAGFFYIQSTYKGKAWFVVLDGPYPDKAKANRAVASMPEKIRKMTPWIRSVKGVQ